MSVDFKLKFNTKGCFWPFPLQQSCLYPFPIRHERSRVMTPQMSNLRGCARVALSEGRLAATWFEKIKKPAHMTRPDPHPKVTWVVKETSIIRRATFHDSLSPLSYHRTYLKSLQSSVDICVYIGLAWGALYYLNLLPREKIEKIIALYFAWIGFKFRRSDV